MNKFRDEGFHQRKFSSPEDDRLFLFVNASTTQIIMKYFKPYSVDPQIKQLLSGETVIESFVDVSFLGIGVDTDTEFHKHISKI